MKPSVLLFWVFAALSSKGIGQDHQGKDIEIPLLNAGTVNWPIKLTKQAFEGDTIYNLTFRDALHNPAGQESKQGLYIFELKAFGKALETALSMGPGYEIRFSEGVIQIRRSGSGSRRIRIKFAAGTGSFVTTPTNATNLIYTIEKEGRIKHKVSN
jgi:hypothetical protein